MDKKMALIVGSALVFAGYGPSLVIPQFFTYEPLPAIIIGWVVTVVTLILFTIGVRMKS